MLQPDPHALGSNPIANSRCSTGAVDGWTAAVQSLDQLGRGLERALDLDGRLGDAARHHLATGGKRLRGRLALATGLGLGLSAEQSLAPAIAVELLHNASLIHDDLQDADRRRRGALAVWAKFDKPTALLLGDAMIAASFEALTSGAGPRLAERVRLLSACITGLAAGQCSDGARGEPLPRTIAAYEALSRAKTGLLFTLPAELVMLRWTSDATALAAARESLELVGIAFQIHDDLADVFGTKGRAVGSDLRCNRLSAPVLFHELSERPRPRSTSGGSRFDGLPLERQAEIIRSGPGVGLAMRHQQHAIQRAASAARVLPAGLRDVIAGLARDVLAASSRLAVVDDAPAQLDRAGVAH